MVTDGREVINLKFEDFYVLIEQLEKQGTFKEFEELIRPVIENNIASFNEADLYKKEVLTELLAITSRETYKAAFVNAAMIHYGVEGSIPSYEDLMKKLSKPSVDEQ